MGWNVPDDWGSYYSNCDYCGGRYHASEGGCHCLEDHEQCYFCQVEAGERSFCGGDRRVDEGWHHISRLTQVGDTYLCEDHTICDCCKVSKITAENFARWDESEDLWVYCSKCGPEDHYCEKDGPLLDHIANKVDHAE